MREKIIREGSLRFIGVVAALGLVGWAGVTSAQASTDPSPSVESFYGAFESAVPLAVPAFRGMEPPLRLAYGSTGGTHATRIESYQRIRYDAASNSWTVTQKDGLRSVYTPLLHYRLKTVDVTVSGARLRAWRLA